MDILFVALKKMGPPNDHPNQRTADRGAGMKCPKCGYDDLDTGDTAHICGWGKTPRPTVTDPVVGWKTIRAEDGSTRREPLHKTEADSLMREIGEAKQRRAALMPTEADAARMMKSAWDRLKELGWQETCYGPTNTLVRLIEPGSRGIHEGIRYNDWPEKTWWIDGDMPSNPCLFKPKDATRSAGKEVA